MPLIIVLILVEIIIIVIKEVEIVIGEEVVEMAEALLV